MMTSELNARRPAEEWYRWADVLATYPGRLETMPRIDVIPAGRAPADGERYGWYDPHRHAVVVIDTAYWPETLHTLIHELAHAWSPPERRHHGPGWERVMCAVTAWLFGVEVDHATILEKAAELHRLEPHRTRAQARRLAFDIALHYQIIRCRPTITINPDAISVSIDNGRVVHRVARET